MGCISMSKISFAAFCVEFYAEHSKQANSDVYALFEESGLLAMLNDDYDDLHGMSMEYLLGFFDEYLKGVAR